VARYGSKDPLPGLFLLGVLCLGIGCFVRYKAWQADGKLKSWTRVTADVLGVRPYEAPAGRYGTKTRYAVHLRYETPRGPMIRAVDLTARPTTLVVPVYFDPADPASLPEPESLLVAVTSPSNVTAAYAFAAGGVLVVALSGYALHRRRRRSNTDARM
jgi:hypothetical protein